MVRYIDLRIAGIQIQVSYASFPLAEDAYPYYGNFLTDSQTCSPDLSVNVEFRTPERPQPHWEIVFDSGSSWKMFSREKGFIVVIGRNQGDEGMIQAYFDQELETLAVACSPEYVNSATAKVPFPFVYPLDQLVLSRLRGKREGLLLHGAGLGWRDEGCVFLGRSGAGKSTLMKRFDSVRDVVRLSDDRMIVREKDDGFSAYGSPWPGEGAIAVNGNAPLKRLFFLSKARVNRIQHLSRVEAMERLLPVASILWYDEELMTRNLAFVERLVDNIPAYLLHFRPDRGVVKVLGDFLGTE